jgi:hypothetical protein
MTSKSQLLPCLSAAMMLLLSASYSSAATTKTAAQCEALFMQADKDGDGSLAQHEDTKWQEHITRMERLPKDTIIIHKDDFMAACQKGDFDDMM